MARRHSTSFVTISLPLALYASLFAAVSGTPVPPGTVLPSTFTLAPLYTPPNPLSADSSSSAPHAQAETDSHIVSDSYIVVLKDHVDQHEIEAHHAAVEQVHSNDMRFIALKYDDSTAAAVQPPTFEGIKHKFHVGKKSKKTVKGYSGHFTESTLDAIRAMDAVKYVERDSLVFASNLEKGAPWVRLFLTSLH